MLVNVIQLAFDNVSSLITKVELLEVGSRQTYGLTCLSDSAWHSCALCSTASDCCGCIRAFMVEQLLAAFVASQFVSVSVGALWLPQVQISCTTPTGLS